MDYVSALGAACGPAFGQHVIDAYRQIAPADGLSEVGQLAKPQLSRPNIRYEFEATLPQLEGALLLGEDAAPPLVTARRRRKNILSVFIEGKNVAEKEVKLEMVYIISCITGTRLE